MSTTSNAQNLLVNVFQPYYTYDPVSTLFTPAIELTNVIATATTNTDNDANVYVGSAAGNAASAPRGSARNVAVGVGAGNLISNTTDSIFLGYEAGEQTLAGSNIVVIGANATVGPTSINSVFIGASQDVCGSSSVFVGAGSSGFGSNNIVLGQGVSIGNVSNVFRVGTNYLYGDMSNRWLGIGVPTASSTTANLDVSGGIASTAGFTSGTGTITSAGIGSTTTIGTLKKAAILVSAQDTASSNHYQTIQVYCPDPTNGSSTVAMTNAVQAGEISIVFQAGGSNIQISNATTVRNIGWSVTYFPVP